VDSCSSESLFLIVFEFQYEGLHILAQLLPLLDALLGIGVELLLLVIEQRLGRRSLVDIPDVLLLCGLLPQLGLGLLVGLELDLFVS
jgi:hypothetical protein